MNERNLSSQLEQLYQVLKQIDEGQDIFSPDGDDIEDLKKFQSTARCLQEAERRGYIGKIVPRESFMNDGRAGMALEVNIIKGLTFKGHEILNNPKKLLIDNNPQATIDMSTTINQHVTNSTIYGSVIAAEKIEHSFNSLQESKASDDAKTLLEQLLTEIKVLNGKVPATQAQAIEKMTKGAETLVNESKSAAPDQAWYELSFKDIKDAVTTIGEMAKPVWEVAEKLSPLLLTI